MTNKHTATWAVIALLAVFLALLIWYLVVTPAPTAQAPSDGTATSTPSAPGEPIHITENTQYYELDATYPSATPLAGTAGAEAEAAAVARLKAFAETSLAEFKANNELESITAERAEFERLVDGRKYAMGIEYNLYESPKTITYVYQIFADTLGAHPNTTYRTFTFDRASGAELALADLFTPGADYLARVSQETRAALPPIMARMANISEAEVDIDYINSGTTPQAESFQSFALDGTNLVIIFPPYQVAPYVYGRMDVEIPFTDLSDILKAEYQP